MTVGHSFNCIVASVKPITLNQFIAFSLVLLSKKHALLVYAQPNICTAVDIFIAISVAGLFACFVVCMWNAFVL